MRSKISFTKELRMAIALLEIPVSGCTCLRTDHTSYQHHPIAKMPTGVNAQSMTMYLCKYMSCMSPCEPCDASSFPHQLVGQLCSCSLSSWQPSCLQSWPVLCQRRMRGLCRQWKRAFVNQYRRSWDCEMNGCIL
jgi:hypothetical protein